MLKIIRSRAVLESLFEIQAKSNKGKLRVRRMTFAGLPAVLGLAGLLSRPRFRLGEGRPSEQQAALDKSRRFMMLPRMDLSEWFSRGDSD